MRSCRSLMSWFLSAWMRCSCSMRSWLSCCSFTRAISLHVLTLISAANYSFLGLHCTICSAARCAICFLGYIGILMGWPCSCEAWRIHCFTIAALTGWLQALLLDFVCSSRLALLAGFMCGCLGPALELWALVDCGFMHCWCIGHAGYTLGPAPVMKKAGLQKDVVTLRWSTPKSAPLDLQFCTSAYRVTPNNVSPSTHSKLSGAN